MPKYSAWSLTRHGVSGAAWPPILRRHGRRDSYDIVIIALDTRRRKTAV